MQKLLVLQSLWAMERRHTDGFEPSIEENIRKIAEAGFDGINSHWVDRDVARRATATMAGTGMQVEGICFPKTVDELKPVLEICTEFPVLHLNIQADSRTRSLGEAAALVEGWMDLASEVDFAVYFETHRDRLTMDLDFTLDLLARVPEMRLIADLSHYLVAREFAFPVSQENHAMMQKIMDHAGAYHGRVASHEQIQVEISFPHHRMWLDLFCHWWRYGFDNWRRKAAPTAALAFCCELGPKPYAITGRDGNDTTDRWNEALDLMALVRELWSAQASNAA
ncbi:xylose isomerase [Kaistia sp. 32K]|uniref:sugar phosphate isomerase/epimerase family protein n=1 Tax=Kaistia sp. 32K TaxID=2795690 RepID=UPI0019166854|nr:sugar phosphate isomerase/epimerase [Kaistia sp. 32K]BCP53982.1 xylose isomerase [Kaistia sp. 32K]